MIRFIFSTTGMILAGAIFFVYTKPHYDLVQTSQAKVAQYNEALGKAAELQQLKASLLDQYNSFSAADRDRLEKMVPNHVDNIALIMDLDGLASHYAMTLENVNISTPADQGQSKIEVASIGSGDPKFNSLTVQFSVHNTYPVLLQFMSSLQSSLRLVDPISFTITPSGTSPSGEPSYAYSITLRTYWLK